MAFRMYLCGRSDNTKLLWFEDKLYAKASKSYAYAPPRWGLYAPVAVVATRCVTICATSSRAGIPQWGLRSP